jgi:hypothetical protein
MWQQGSFGWHQKSRMLPLSSLPDTYRSYPEFGFTSRPTAAHYIEADQQQPKTVWHRKCTAIDLRAELHCRQQITGKLSQCWILGSGVGGCCDLLRAMVRIWAHLYVRMLSPTNSSLWGLTYLRCWSSTWCMNSNLVFGKHCSSISYKS